MDEHFRTGSFSTADSKNIIFQLANDLRLASGTGGIFFSGSHAGWRTKEHTYIALLVGFGRRAIQKGIITAVDEIEK